MIHAMKKNAAILAIFAVASTAVVAITNALTEDQIKHQEQTQLLKVLNQVIPAESHDNVLFKSCTLVNAPSYLGTDSNMPVYLATKNNQPTGVAIEAIAPDGYNGAIKVIVGLASDATVTGVRVLSHQETPGLGDKVDLRITDWILSFTGQTVDGEKDTRWAVRKDGGNFDQFTGATITPRAVVKAVKQVVQYYQANQETIYNQPLNCQEES